MAGRAIQHISYVVDDLERAVVEWGRIFGAGPFFLLDHIEFDEIQHDGAAASFDHSAAFGQWGPIAVELQQIHSIEPPSLDEQIRRRGPAVNHVSYVADDAEAESRRLESLGLHQFLYAKTGPIEVRFHELPGMAHAVEIHQRNDFLEGFMAMTATAAEGWDGSEPLRAIPES
jgi:hypothetical protein